MKGPKGCRRVVVAIVAVILAGAAIAGQARATDPSDCGALNVAGRWAGSGLDEDGARWDWSMELTQSRCEVQGVITWRASSGSAGREHIRGRLDGATRRFDFRGQQMEQGRGAIILGIYHATFSPDLRRITGRWTNGIPGTFEGARQ